MRKAARIRQLFFCTLVPSFFFIKKKNNFKYSNNSIWRNWNLYYSSFKYQWQSTTQYQNKWQTNNIEYIELAFRSIQSHHKAWNRQFRIKKNSETMIFQSLVLLYDILKILNWEYYKWFNSNNTNAKAAYFR